MGHNGTDLRTLQERLKRGDYLHYESVSETLTHCNVNKDVENKIFTKPQFSYSTATKAYIFTNIYSL
jgi:hypothetical protein